mgnify:CR=1 FL=1
MIKDNQKYFNRLQVVLDALVIIVSYLIAWYIMMRFVASETVGVLPPEVYMAMLLFLLPIFLLLYYACDLYTPKRTRAASGRKQYPESECDRRTDLHGGAVLVRGR